MKDFEYANPSNLDDAIGLLSKSWDKAEVLAGGTDLVSSLKQGVTAPERVVSLKNVAGLGGIKAADGNLRVGAMATLREFIDDGELRKSFPGLVTAVKNIRSAQIINAGTVGGDLLQRPRCWYFRQGFGLLAEVKRKSLVPDGDNRYHAIFGNKGPAYFVNASSLAPGLIALDASVSVQGPKGSREIKVADLHATPRKDGEREHVLKPNEILTAIIIPIKGLRNATFEIRPRQTLDWPMVAASVAFAYEGGKASKSRVVLGHVAPVPWLSEAASAALDGQRVSEETAAAAGKAAAEGATPLSGNGYKVQQVKVAVKRAIMASMA